jgi:hypothetical protein
VLIGVVSALIALRKRPMEKMPHPQLEPAGAGLK